MKPLLGFFEPIEDSLKFRTHALSAYITIGAKYQEVDFETKSINEIIDRVKLDIEQTVDNEIQKIKWSSESSRQVAKALIEKNDDSKDVKASKLEEVNRRILMTEKNRIEHLKKEIHLLDKSPSRNEALIRKACILGQVTKREMNSRARTKVTKFSPSLVIDPTLGWAASLANNILVTRKMNRDVKNKLTVNELITLGALSPTASELSMKKIIEQFTGFNKPKEFEAFYKQATSGGTLAPFPTKSNTYKINR